MKTSSRNTNLKYVRCICTATIAALTIFAQPTMAADAPAADQAAAPAAPATAAPAAAVPAAPEQQIATVHTAGPSSDSDILSVTFQKDTSIRDALRYLAAKYQKNIIPSAKVDGALTVSTLYDVTFDQAMKAILCNKFIYEQDGSFIRVYTAA